LDIPIAKITDEYFELHTPDEKASDIAVAGGFFGDGGTAYRDQV
jgi:hypothetical protein